MRVETTLISCCIVKKQEIIVMVHVLKLLRSNLRLLWVCWLLPFKSWLVSKYESIITDSVKSSLSNLLKRLSRGGLALLLSLSVFFPVQYIYADESDSISTLVDYANQMGIERWQITLEYYYFGNGSNAAIYYCLYNMTNLKKPVKYMLHSALQAEEYTLIATPDSSNVKYFLISTVTDYQQYNRLISYVPSLESYGAYMLFENPENSTTLLKEYPQTGWLHGSFFTKTGYTKANHVSVSDRYTQYLIFYANTRVASLNLYDSSGSLAYSFGYQYRYLRGDVYYHIFKIDIDKTDYFDFYFVPTSDGAPTDILPIYWGFDIAMTDDMRVQAFLPTQTSSSVSGIESAVVDGTTESQGQAGQLVEKNDSLNTVINDYDSMEKGFQDNVSSSLSAIDPGSSVEWTADILTTFNFVSVKVTDIYNGMGSFKVLIMFSLVLGLALLLIGVDAKK